MKTEEREEGRRGGEERRETKKNSPLITRGIGENLYLDSICLCAHKLSTSGKAW
jgi:hypothetical protein